MSDIKQLDKKLENKFETKNSNDFQISKIIKIIETLEKEFDDNQKKDENNFNHLIAYFVFDLLDYARKNYSDYSFSKNITDFEEKLTKNFEIGGVQDDE